METQPHPAPPLPDLTICDQEPIHIPGAIQPYGCLLACAGDPLRVLHGTATSGILLGTPLPTILGTELRDGLGSGLAQVLGEALARHRIMPSIPGGFTWQGPPQGAALAGYVHVSGGLTLVEFEPLDGDDPPGAADPAPAMTALNWVRAETGLEAKAQSAAALVQQLTGFDRVLVYRFDADWNGEVIAESRGAPLESYLGLHYPATDIPAQARRLYLVNPTRVIADRDAVQSPILPAWGQPTDTPLDLTKSLLRSVSPVHLEYLRNMGVRASLSSALSRDGALWGLISCHHSEPRRLSRGLRELLGWMVQDLATQFALAEELRTRHYAIRLKTSRDNVIAAMRGGARLSSLIQGSELGDVLGAIGADGAALIRGEEMTLGGITPQPVQIRRIVEGLSGIDPDDPSGVFLTDCLSRQVPAAADLAATAAGLALFPLAGAPLVKLMWFRGERVRLVTWAGNPEKAADLSPDGRINPRKSFAAWTETVRLHSLPWTAEEVESARFLTALVDIELHKTIEDALRTSLADVARLREALLESRVRDPLTGLFSRHYLDERLQRELARMRETGRVLVLAMVELDGLDALGAMHGQEAVDRILNTVASLMTRSHQRGDVVCPTGRAGFMWMMPEVETDEATARIEQLRRDIEALAPRGFVEHSANGSVLSAAVIAAVVADRDTDAVALQAQVRAALGLSREEGRTALKRAQG